MLEAADSLAAAFWAALHLRTLLLAAVTFLFLADYLKSRRPKNYPPRPPRLPFVGNSFQMDLTQSHLAVQKFVKKYGNVISLDFGIKSAVIISSLPLIKEAFSHLDENFINRRIFPLQRQIFNGNGQPFDPHFKIYSAVSNIICSITFGERFEYHDSQFQELLQLLDKAMYLGTTSLMVHLYNIFPWITKHLPGQHQTLLATWRKLKSYIADIIDNHRKDWNPDEPRDFIDAFLNEMAKYPGKTTTSFNEENLICSTLDLFLAGTETTSSTLRWALLYMALYPEVQENVQAEIDRVIGQSKHPSLADRDSMPYTNAVVHEILRMGNSVPLNIPREVAVDTTLAGFHLPKRSVVMTNLTALHMDPKEWATPDIFNPEHFLENGQFKKRESFLPFSMGKRACLGEQLARSELFIFFTALVQKFTFKPPANENLSLKFRLGITISPVSYRIGAVPRQ
ncbi:cytochrome P450, family 2, subfamily j, polypeptide 13 isoform X1 [Mus musculus]|uniref:cytochrome P450, family 2, subfamily j, polypeptide 13 isoform X1 n=1 Tax=Mus musculus TaxID=10090 RepID=UPI0003D72662|nr:cytochrome P450, family 2, subfamily j, polypeptide 13 isoform X1 [Mus musculus]|eukprot:XP_006502998.1 PREDICTED: cytochrome P450, family 2, subfamily j, polypeptide 13 isoform X1 [Mus musculus]